ncbi:Magnesium and cobalt efflux protein CorC [Poriferisphaera corsica]|uniref:Magnesium and cobalt efflux protein CorC n=1 Tax=Poriferisphaera corsica TaxID=2528020 RepID=A0A517YT48_9BACT|nr:CNNM domain-containing protein [Poriferisphaera corsica]QDU33405.1 Magnesium and cobalt efflux protein CorC [Poriferisphaera corsica]
MNHELIFWTCMMLLGFMGSAIYSGLETGVYRLNRVMLHIETQRGSKRARSIDKLLTNQSTLLSTLLIGNNATNQLGTAALAVILSLWGYNEWQSILLNTLIVTPILFVFGETLPKDLFAAHPDKLVYRFYNILRGSKIAFTSLGFVPLVSGFTHCLMKLFRSSADVQTFNPRNQPRHHIELLVKESVGYGLLSDDISEMAGRVLAMSEITVDQKMVPWHDVMTVHIDSKPEVLWDFARKNRGSRYPVINDSNHVIGVLLINDVLIHNADTCPPIRDLMLKPFQINQNTSVRDGLKALQHHHRYMGIICSSMNKPLGIVTVKDLIEPITGSISHF